MSLMIIHGNLGGRLAGRASHAVEGHPPPWPRLACLASPASPCLPRLACLAYLAYLRLPRLAALHMGLPMRTDRRVMHKSGYRHVCNLCAIIH